MGGGYDYIGNMGGYLFLVVFMREGGKKGKIKGGELLKN